MDRQNLYRRILLFCGVGAWVFLMLAIASFNPADPPSHQVYPPQPVHNLCGAVGATIAYYIYFAIGQGVFLAIFFTGILLALMVFHNRISDLWLRTIGLAMMCVAFAALVHLIRPGSADSFPEGHGGILGIAAAAFLKYYFHTAGTA